MFRATIASLLCFVFVSPAVAALDPNDPSDAIKINRKINCSLIDGEAVTYAWSGYLYSRRMGERDKKLFAVEGMNIRACRPDEHEEMGKGFKLVSREILLYLDPESGEVLSTWENPWTGEEVEVLHVANDPVNFSSYETGQDGKPAIWAGEIAGAQWASSFQAPLYYPNPLASDFQKEIGGIYHATEMFNFFGTTKDLLDARRNSAAVHVGWTRVSDWLPWMNMSGREGTIYVHAAGRKIDKWDELSATMRSEIEKHYPEYVAPPALDDTRRNETSWIYYKRVKSGERVAPKRD